MNQIDPKNPPKILLVNDDGIDAPGLQTLRRHIQDHCDLLVVAPMSERSGAGCSLSLNDEMAVEERTQDGKTWGWSVDGTPADCVKFAMTALPGYDPDLVISGINRGRNVGNFIWYSGTVAGALEATMFGKRAMAVSLAAFKDDAYHFQGAAEITLSLIPWLMSQTWRPRTLWNLNTPNIPLEEVQGIRATHQGTTYFVDEFAFSREENGVRYYRNAGNHVVGSEVAENDDDSVLKRGFASLSFLTTDLTIDVTPAASEALEREWNQLAFGRPGIKELS